VKQAWQASTSRSSSFALDIMKVYALFSLLASAPAVLAQVKGAPFGFAAGTTGGGNAAPVYPKTNAE
jgi:hypothetical protein